MEEEDLKKAIVLIKAGNKSDSVPILKNILKTNRNNELAWLWLSVCADNTEDKKYCLQEALRINPNNEHVKKALEQMQIESEFIPPPTLREMGVIEPPNLPFNNLQNNTQPINPEMNQVSKLEASNPVSNVIIVLLVVMGLFWLAIGFIQIGNSQILVGIWNIVISIINLTLIRNVIRRSHRVVNSLIFLGVVGGIWGLVQLLSGAWLQAFAIPIYIVLAVLAGTNKEYFSD